MKIGILTQPLHKNYGGLLQNYALQQVLKSMGHDAETIDHVRKPVPFLHKTLSDIKASVLHSLFPTRYRKPIYIPSAREIAIIRSNTDSFINNYISRTKILHSSKEFDDIANANKYGAYIVGSDQCWRPRFNDYFLSDMFLRFAVNQSNVKRIAYAASFGTSEWEFSPAMTETCGRLAKKFNMITVREKSGVDLCREHLGVEAVQVLDPTLLLDKENYIKIVEADGVLISNGTLFHYILDPSEEKEKMIQNVATNLRLRPFTIMPKCQAENRTKKDVKKRIEDCVFPSVTSWLRGFIDAKMVIVDSFHGAVFSIIFNKPFWVLANAKRGNARFESLLDMFGLEDRMISMDSLSVDFDWNKEINWRRVNEIRQQEVVRCKSLLEVALKQ